MKHLAGAQAKEIRKYGRVLLIYLENQKPETDNAFTICALILRKVVEMSKVIFTHIHIENFCNHKVFDADLFEKTLVSGHNKSGKSTIRNAILWVLYGSLENGKDAGTSIRPQTEDGKPVDFVDISVSLTINVDGSEYILTKKQRQKWTTHRGSEEKVKTGNENIYEISGIPKREKDFKEFVNENVCSIEELPFCMSASTFLSLDAKKRRAKVLGLAKSFTDDDVIATDARFEMLRNDLRVGTIDEIMKRSKQTLSALKKTLSELPARIDEASKQIVEFPFSELELERKTLNDDLAKIAEAENEKTETESRIMKAKFELSEIENRITSKANDKQNEYNLAIMWLNNTLRSLNDEIARYESDKEKAMSLIKNNEVAIKEAEKQKEIASERVFDDSSLVCPTCGQEYPRDKEKEIRERFEKNRQDEMSRLVDYIESLKNGMQTAKARVEDCEKLISEKTDKAYYVKRDIQNNENFLAGVVLDDPTKDDAYKAKQDEITALQAKVEKYALDNSKAEINAKIKEVERKLAQAESNNRAEERIEQLKAEQKVVAQNILNQERIIALLEDYNKAKIGMLEDSVNQYFDLIKWKFFIQQENGSLAETCKILVGGVDYEVTLNKSDRILCQIDLCKGFMKSAGVNMPLLADDMESVDSDRVPDYDGQMILFKREDSELIVKSM